MSVEQRKSGDLIWAKGLPYRFLHHGWSNGLYVDFIVCLKDNPLSQLVGICFYWLTKIQEYLIPFYLQRYKLKEGDYYPKYSFAWWLGQSCVVSQKFGTRIYREDMI